MSAITLKKVEYVTLYTGNNGSEACTCKCPCCSQEGRKYRYQGTMTQALEMFEKLPEMKQLYLFGNPDVTVDSDFCHAIISEAVKRNIHVCFSTSGVGGKLTLKKLLRGIPTKMVDYISFSFDSTTKQDMSIMKGICYPMEKALNGLEWAINNGYTVKVQPTLWSYNYTKVSEIIKYFSHKGVKWFTFHVGSLESGISLHSHQHLTPQQVANVHEQISEAVYNHVDIKVRCPIIYSECGSNDYEKWYCMYPEKAKELLLIFTADEIKATHAPLASLFKDYLTFNLNEAETTDIPAVQKHAFCPFSSKLSGRNDTCCRYISKYWNY